MKKTLDDEGREGKFYFQLQLHLGHVTKTMSEVGKLLHANQL